MFGLYRTFLALLVVANHLLVLPLVGHYAVHGFFVLSGFLMTLILHQTYGYSLKGRALFALNRMLRLIPSYWAVLGIVLVLVAIWGEDATSAYRTLIFLPHDLVDWVQNLSLIYFDVMPVRVAPRLSPPTWALTVELFFYLLIGLGISRSRRWTLAWLLLSGLYLLATHLPELGYNWRFYSIFAGSFPFALGATIFHFRKSLGRRLAFLWNPFACVGLFLALLLNPILALRAEDFGSWMPIGSISFYGNYLLNGVLVLLLTQTNPPGLTKRWDAVIGGFSYPLYLLHWPMGFLASMLVFHRPVKGLSLSGVEVMLLSILFSAIATVGIHFVVERPIEGIRRRLRLTATRPPIALSTEPRATRSA